MYQKLIFLFVFSLFLLSAGTQAQSEEIVWTKRTLNDLGIKGDVMNAIFSPDDSRICVTTTKTFVELDPANGEIIREIPDIFGAIFFSKDGKYFYTYDYKKVDYETMEVLGTYDIHGTYLREYDVNEEAGVLIGARYKGREDPWPEGGIVICDLNNYNKIIEVGEFGHYYYDVKISNDGKYIIAQSQYDPDLSTQVENRSVMTLWDVKTHEPIREIEGVLGYYKFSPNNNLLGSVGGNLVRVHDTKTWEMKYEFMQDPYNGLLTALDFTSDSKYLATGGKGSPVITNIHIWNLEKGELETKFNDLFNVLIPDKLYYNKNGSNILASSAGRISLLNVPTTGVTEKEFNDDSIMYPNPSSGKIEFENGSFRIGQLSIQLSDVNGKQLEILYDETYNDEFLSFDISYLPNGIYFITVTQKDYVHTYKLIKE